jgi:hypothetical protein
VSQNLDREEAEHVCGFSKNTVNQDARTHEDSFAVKNRIADWNFRLMSNWWACATANSAEATHSTLCSANPITKMQ